MLHEQYSQFTSHTEGTEGCDCTAVSAHACVFAWKILYLEDRLHLWPKEIIRVVSLQAFMAIERNAGGFVRAPYSDMFMNTRHKHARKRLKRAKM